MTDFIVDIINHKIRKLYIDIVSVSKCFVTNS